MEELNPQFLENLEVLGEIQEDEIVHQDPFEDQHKFIKNEMNTKNARTHGMSIDSYHMFASLLEQQLLDPTSWEEQLCAPTPQCLGEAKATSK
jgi:hypothetical protein